MSIDLFTLDEEDYICEGGIVYDLAHVLNKRVNGFVIEFILLQLANVQNANIIQPLAAIKATEDEELLCANHTGSVALTTCRSLFALSGMTPAHSVCVENVEIVRGNNLLEGATSAIVTTKEIDLVSNQVSSMTSQSFGRAAIDEWLSPCQGLIVKNMKVLQVLVARVTAKQVKFGAQYSHIMRVSCHRLHALHRRLDPGNGVQIQNIDIVEALVPVITSKHI